MSSFISTGPYSSFTSDRKSHSSASSGNCLQSSQLDYSTIAGSTSSAAVAAAVNNQISPPPSSSSPPPLASSSASSTNSQCLVSYLRRPFSTEYDTGEDANKYSLSSSYLDSKKILSKYSPYFLQQSGTQYSQQYPQKYLPPTYPFNPFSTDEPLSEIAGFKLPVIGNCYSDFNGSANYRPETKMLNHHHHHHHHHQLSTVLSMSPPISATSISSPTDSVEQKPMVELKSTEDNTNVDSYGDSDLRYKNTPKRSKGVHQQQQVEPEEEEEEEEEDRVDSEDSEEDAKPSVDLIEQLKKKKVKKLSRRRSSKELLNNTNPNNNNKNNSSHNMEAYLADDEHNDKETGSQKNPSHSYTDQAYTVQSTQPTTTTTTYYHNQNNRTTTPSDVYNLAGTSANIHHHQQQQQQQQQQQMSSSGQYFTTTTSTSGSSQFYW